MSAAENTTANGASGYEGNGVGGKFRRRPLRKSQATPYDRPPVVAVRNPSSGKGWMSMIVDPASKFVTAGARRLFSSMFAKRLLPPPQQTPPPTQPPATTLPVSDASRNADSEPRSETLAKYRNSLQDQSGTDHHADKHDLLDNTGKNHGISELEKILTQKTFTKSEIERLTTLLNSRTIEDTTEKVMNVSEARTLPLFENGNVKEVKSTPVPDNGFGSIRHLGAGPSHVLNTEDIEEDIATPAELAKAYMGSRPSKVSPSLLGLRGQSIRSDLPLMNSVVFPSQSPSMNTATKSVSRLGPPENGYITPRSRGRSAIYCMARTPYSRMQKGSDIRSGNNHNFHSSQHLLEANTLSNSRQTALKRRSNDLDDDISSIGPVRRIRQKSGPLSSQRLTGPAGASSPINGTGVLSNYRLKDSGKKSRGANFMSVPSQSNDVAQKILQQLEKISPPPKEKSSELKSTQLPGKSTFTLMPDMLSGQALRSLEKIDSSKFIESSQGNSKVNDSVQRMTTNVDYAASNGMNQIEENGPKKLTSVSKNNSESALNSSDRIFVQNKRAFQMSAREDYLDSDGNNRRSNGTSFALAEGKDSHVNSSLETANENSISKEGKAHVSFLLDNKSDGQRTVTNGPIISEKEERVSYSSGSPTMSIQPTATNNVSSSIFGKVSSDGQPTMTLLFGNATKAAVNPLPFTFSSSPTTANDSQALQTSAPSETKSPISSVLFDNSQTKPDVTKGTQGTADFDAKVSTASSTGVSTSSTLFSSSSFMNHGFANGSFSFQPATASSSAPSSDPSGADAHHPNSSTSVPNAATGISSGGANLFSTSAAPFSASPVFAQSLSKKDTQESFKPNVLTSEVKETAKPVTAAGNTLSNTFGGMSSATPNRTGVNTGFGSSMSFPNGENLGHGSVNNTSDAPSNTTSVSNNTPFLFGSSGVSSAPTFGLSGTPTFTSAPAASFGLNSAPSSKDAGIFSSNVGSNNSLFGSNWQSNSSPLFGSTISSSADPLSAPQFGSSAASSASIPPNSTSGSIFGSTGASVASALSFTSASTNTSQSQFSAPQPVFGSSNPVLSFGSAASPPNFAINNTQTSMEDSMAEDTVQASAPSTPLFGQQPQSMVQASTPSTPVFGQPQPQSMSNSGFVFGSPSPSATPPAANNLFQFGNQPNQSPFPASGSFNTGSGSFSLGTGGEDKAGRRIVKVKRGPKRR